MRFRLLFLLVFISFFAGAQTKKCCLKFSSAVSKQTLWDQTTALASIDYWQGPVNTNGQGGFFTTTGLVTQCTDGQECYGLKSSGANPPSPSNVLFAGSTALTPSNALVWFKDDGNSTGLMPMFFDNGNFDKGLRFRNGPPNVGYYETNPGSFTAKTQPIDIFLVLRYLPHTPDEGLNRVKALNSTLATEQISAIDGWTPDITTTAGVTYNYYVSNVLEVLTRSDNTTQMWLNGTSIKTGTATSFSTTEWIWGTASHNQQDEVMCMITKFGEFSSADRTTISSNLQTIWPAVKPPYPYITELFYGDASTWDGTAKSWRAGRGHTPVFSGGNGVAGTTKYVWYWFDSGDATLFPSVDGVLTNHRQVPGSVDISTMASGNSVTQISIDGANLMSGSVSWATSASATADAIVTNINANQSAFLAQHRAGGTILFHPQGTGCNSYHTNAVTITASGFSPTKIDAPRGQDLVRTTYAVTGQIFDGHQGDNVMKVACITYPFDSSGTGGPAIPMRWTNDNIP